MSQKHEDRTCPACGDVMRRSVRPETVTCNGHSLNHAQPGWHCTACEEGVLEGEDNLVHDAALRELTAVAANPTGAVLVAALRTGATNDPGVPAETYRPAVRTVEL